MAQDLRKLLEEQRTKEKFEINKGHENRFLERLDEDLPLQKKRDGMGWIGIAASVVIVLGLGVYFFINDRNGNQPDREVQVVTKDATENEHQNISLGDLSPDLQKLENYYLANINLELASLEVSDENKELVNGYMQQLSELSQEYKLLIKELNEIGPNDQTIEALIKNFQLQLSLIQKLKAKLNQLKSSENEQQTAII